MFGDFCVTEIDKVILVETDTVKEKVCSFNPNLLTSELIFHFSGLGEVHFNGKTLVTDAGCVRFLPKGENDEYTVEKKIAGECIDVFFQTDRPVSQEAFVIKLDKSETIGRLFKKLFAVWVSKDEGYYFECISILYKIFAELQKENYIPNSQYQAIKPAIKYIEEHFLEEKISSEKLASLSGVSYSYLKKLFVKKFSLPPAKYIIQLKINYACDLLRTDIYNISEIAEVCGYRDVYFFSRQFKEYMGVSPSEFKEKYKN